MARINFIELPASQFAASQAFYHTVFAFDFTAFGPTYASTMTGEVDLGLQGQVGETPTAPLVVIEVADLEATYLAAAAAGAKITREIFAFPGGKRFQFRDPSGNEMAAWVQVTD